VDLSGIIFVVLAVGWACYLIPMALKHHDDQAKSRPVDTFSDSVRVVGAAARVATPTATPAATPTATATALAEPEAPRAHTISRAAARRAARRRRRVLAVLLLALVAVVVTSYLAYTPWWSTVVPAGMIIAFLVTARLTVRAQQVRRAAPVQPAQTAAPAEAVEPQAPSRAAAPAEVEPDLGREDTQGLSRDELAEAIAAPVLDEGGLWDPLPVTLPTYVTKARARRTVRTIEITGMTSSGHDAADTALARTAEEAAKAEAAARAQAEADEEAERKAAGA
jgi:flagellar basal body-associated protein FliL